MKLRITASALALVAFSALAAAQQYNVTYNLSLTTSDNIYDIMLYDQDQFGNSYLDYAYSAQGPGNVSINDVFTESFVQQPSFLGLITDGNGDHVVLDVASTQASTFIGQDFNTLFTDTTEASLTQSIKDANDGLGDAKQQAGINALFNFMGNDMVNNSYLPQYPNQGTLVEFSSGQSIGTVTVTATATPEPTPFLAMGIGSLGLLLVRRRRK